MKPPATLPQEAGVAAPPLCSGVVDGGVCGTVEPPLSSGGVVGVVAGGCVVVCGGGAGVVCVGVVTVGVVAVVLTVGVCWVAVVRGLATVASAGSGSSEPPQAATPTDSASRTGTRRRSVGRGIEAA